MSPREATWRSTSMARSGLHSGAGENAYASGPWRVALVHPLSAMTSGRRVSTSMPPWTSSGRSRRQVDVAWRCRRRRRAIEQRRAGRRVVAWEQRPPRAQCPPRPQRQRRGESGLEARRDEPPGDEPRGDGPAGLGRCPLHRRPRRSTAAPAGEVPVRLRGGTCLESRGCQRPDQGHDRAGHAVEDRAGVGPRAVGEPGHDERCGAAEDGVGERVRDGERAEAHGGREHSERTLGSGRRFLTGATPAPARSRSG